MTRGGIVFSSITIRRFDWELKLNSDDYTEILSPNVTVVSSCQLFLSYSAR